MDPLSTLATATVAEVNDKLSLFSENYIAEFGDVVASVDRA